MPSTGKRRRGEYNEDDSDEDGGYGAESDGDNEPAAVGQTSDTRRVPQRNTKPPCSRLVCAMLRVGISTHDTTLKLLFVDKTIFVKRFSRLLVDVYMKSPEFKECLEIGEVSVPK